MSVIAIAALMRTLRFAVFALVAATGVVALVDWSVRTRRINPFSGTARFFRSRVEPLMLPMERLVVRAGGRSSAVPWWALLGAAVAGLLLIEVAGFLLVFLGDAATALVHPSVLPVVVLGWAFSLLKLALLVRVVSSWLSMSPWSRWVRWSYVLTDWLVGPLRRIVPPLGPIDITPMVAYLILWLLQSALGIP